MLRTAYLGRGVRQVVLSCVVWAVRDHYPAPDGYYLGFKEYLHWSQITDICC